MGCKRRENNYFNSIAKIKEGCKIDMRSFGGAVAQKRTHINFVPTP